MYGPPLTVPSLPELTEPLSDGLIALRLSAERDIPEVLIAYQDDPDLAHALGESRPPSGAQLGRRAELAEADRVTGERVTLAIVQAGADTCCGEVRVDDVDWDARTARLAVWVAPQMRGQGVGRRAGRLARDWLESSCALVASCDLAA
jgi:RimJ/RimL family protein N-acetyltransferase